MISSIGAALAALLLVQSGQAGQARNPAAIVFGSRENVEQASLSPDGTKLAYLGPLKGQGSAVMVVPVDGSAIATAALIADGDPSRIGGCAWVANTRLVCTIYGITRLQGTSLTYWNRYVAFDADGRNLKTLYQINRPSALLGYTINGGDIIDLLPDEDGSVLISRYHVPESSLNTHLADTREGTGVQKVDTRSGRETAVEKPRDNAREYISDGRGRVRIMGVVDPSSDGSTTRYLYRRKGSNDWEALSTVKDDEGFRPRGIDPDLDVAYGFRELNGRTAAYKKALDGSLTETLVFDHPQVDVDGFIRIGRRGRFVGVSYTTDRRQAHYFDPALAKLAKSLAKAIPNLPLIEFVDSSVDESTLLLLAHSDVQPGRYYLFDKQKRELAELMDKRALLGNVQLATVRAVTYKAADGTPIPAYLTLPPGKESAKGLPAIVMPHGGPSARDEWGFDWLSQYFAHQGYAVLQPNFRGSSGYGDSWFEDKGFKSWRIAIGDIDDGGRWLVSEGIADANKLAIFGWSYGGYAALQSAVTEPGLFKAVVAVAPVTDLQRLKDEWFGWSNYRLTSEFIGSGPHIAEGSPARHADKVKVPVLLFHGTDDRNVGYSQSELMANRLKDAGVKSELVTYQKRDHQLFDSEIRADLLSKSDSFLHSSMGF